MEKNRLCSSKLVFVLLGLKRLTFALCVIQCTHLVLRSLNFLPLYHRALEER